VPYKLLFLPEVKDQVSRFLRERYGTPYARKAAADSVHAAFQKLAANPRLASGPPGPFETRPIYRFEIDVDGVVSEAQLVFFYAEDENHLVGIIFGEAPDDG